jgi:recombination protein RecA
LIDAAAEKGVLERTGAWFSYGSERIGQGRENAKQFLRSNPDIRSKLEVDVRKTLGLVPLPELVVAEPMAATRVKK